MAIASPGPRRSDAIANALGGVVTGQRIVDSNTRGAWRAAVPLVLLAGALTTLVVVGGEFDALAGDVVPALTAAALVVVGIARAALWYRCGGDALWADETYLIWARGGRVVTRIRWAEVRQAVLSTPVLPPEWSSKHRFHGGAVLPEVIVSSRSAPEGNSVQQGPGQHLFATLVLLRRADMRAAEAQLAAACAARGMIVSTDGDQRLPWRVRRPFH